LRVAIDSAILIQKRNVDSLSRALEISIHEHTLSLKTLADSLMKPAQELLDLSRIDSAYQLHKKFSGILKIQEQKQRQALYDQLREYKQAIIDLNNSHEACIDCAESEDFKNKLSVFYDDADSLSNAFYDSIAEQFNDASSTLSDSTETLCDFLSVFVETLIADIFIKHGMPQFIRSDNGPEFVAEIIRQWLKDLGIHTAFIEPGSPWKNGYIESFNGKFRDELLN
jgi:hypothetical protein